MVPCVRLYISEIIAVDMSAKGAPLSPPGSSLRGLVKLLRVTVVLHNTRPSTFDFFLTITSAMSCFSESDKSGASFNSNGCLLCIDCLTLFIFVNKSSKSRLFCNILSPGYSPISTKLNPILCKPATASPCLSKPAAIPTGFLNFMPQTSTFRETGSSASFVDKRPHFNTCTAALCATSGFANRASGMTNFFLCCTEFHVFIITRRTERYDIEDLTIDILSPKMNKSPTLLQSERITDTDNACNYCFSIRIEIYGVAQQASDPFGHLLPTFPVHVTIIMKYSVIKTIEYKLSGICINAIAYLLGIGFYYSSTINTLRRVICFPATLPTAQRDTRRHLRLLCSSIVERVAKSPRLFRANSRINWRWSACKKLGGIFEDTEGGDARCYRLLRPLLNVYLVAQVVEQDSRGHIDKIEQNCKISELSRRRTEAEGKMWLPRACVLLVLLAAANCEKHEEEVDASSVFLEAAKSFFSNKDNLNGLQGLAKAFLQSGDRKRAGNGFDGGSNLDGVGQIVSVIGSLFSGSEKGQGIDFSVIGSVLDGVMNSDKGGKRSSRSVEAKQEAAIDLKGIMNVGSMLMGHNGNSDLMMGLIPMLLSNFGNDNNEVDGASSKVHDHSGHSWYMPPIVENLHVMWDHFNIHFLMYTRITLVNAVGKRHLGMKIDSSQYIKPAVSYVKELVALASEKGFIMSRVNAREISNRLSDVINNDIINPILKSYRAYKWSIKRPQCASQILCTINEKNEQDTKQPRLRSYLLKVTSFPAAWAVSNKLETNFWNLYGAIVEHDKCAQKYPADCTDFHEEEIRITTENVHSEL
ncbi:hypothetical protein WN51_01485 [Melipona quadrifasciata]|uniref:Uncharacterized protein n=1 Tax=Melipona quadrifasciata TaxID=166423 RepID=A0A0M8ZY15_9HYME|nr:hypothetical protein WN51_01485 [Melipona quadrifasciata]